MGGWPRPGHIPQLPCIMPSAPGKLRLPHSLCSSTQLLWNRPPLCTQVMHRCPCLKKDICGPLEERVKQLAAEGKLPPYPVEGRTFEPEKMGIETW